MTGSGKIKNNTTSRGFSLIEAMVSLSLLIVGVAGMAAAFQYQVFQSVTARNQSQAAMIAQSVFSELVATDTTGWDLSEVQGNFTYDFSGKKTEEDSDIHYRVTLDQNSEPGYEVVTIGVTWVGWQAQEKRTGYGKENESYAYELEAMLSPQYGDFTVE